MQRLAEGVAAVVVVLVSVLGLIGVASVEAQVECGAPQIVADVATGPPGTAVTLHGMGWADECVALPDVAAPSAGIDLFFRQPGRDVYLTTVDADANYEFTVSVAVPADAAPGVEGGFGTDRFLGNMLTYADFTVTAPARSPARPVYLAPRFTG